MEIIFQAILTKALTSFWIFTEYSIVSLPGTRCTGPNTDLPSMIRLRRFAYQRVRNISSSENCALVLNDLFYYYFIAYYVCIFYIFMIYRITKNFITSIRCYLFSEDGNWNFITEILDFKIRF